MATTTTDWRGMALDWTHEIVSVASRDDLESMIADPETWRQGILLMQGWDLIPADKHDLVLETILGTLRAEAEIRMAVRTEEIA